VTDSGVTGPGVEVRNHPTAERAGLSTLLADWLPRQRWCALAADSAVAVEILEWTPLPDVDPVFHHLVVGATARGQGPRASQVYQVPLTFRPEPDESPTRRQVGEVDGVHVFDALWDRETAVLLMRLLGQGRAVGALDFTSGPAPGLPSDGPPRVLSVEQSNTSLVYGEDVIVKVFRRLWPGVNPDIEIGAVLTEAGAADVPALLGSASGSWPDPTAGGSIARGSLAMAQAFQRNATDGWDLALASVRDLLAEEDLHAEEVGGDFAAEADRLGQTVAGVHVDLARHLPTDSLDGGRTTALAALFRNRLDAAAVELDVLGPLVPGLSALYDALAETGGPIAVQRVHGDLHLGQAVRTLRGWRVLDFEGEPARGISERTALDSPLRDVAGMLRSFEYASRQALAGAAENRQRSYRAAEWRDRNVDAFCRGYAEVSGSDPRESGVLLRAYETDKAVYELLYEARYRPSWIPVPLAALTRLAATEGSTR